MNYFLTRYVVSQANLCQGRLDFYSACTFKVPPHFCAVSTGSFWSPWKPLLMSGLSAYQSLTKRGPSEQYISHKVSVSFPESRQDRQQQTEVLVPQSDKPTENLTLCIALANSLCFLSNPQFNKASLWHEFECLTLWEIPLGCLLHLSPDTYWFITLFCPYTVLTSCLQLLSCRLEQMMEKMLLSPWRIYF